MKDVSWHYVEEPVEGPCLFPPPADVDVRRTGNDIYRARSGRVIGEDGEHDITGEDLKLLDDDCEAPWVYRVLDAVVCLPGGFSETIKPGTRVAVLAKDYQELLKHAHRDAGPQGAPRAHGDDAGGPT